MGSVDGLAERPVSLRPAARAFDGKQSHSAPPPHACSLLSGNGSTVSIQVDNDTTSLKVAEVMGWGGFAPFGQADLPAPVLTQRLNSPACRRVRGFPAFYAPAIGISLLQIVKRMPPTRRWCQSTRLQSSPNGRASEIIPGYTEPTPCLRQPLAPAPVSRRSDWGSRVQPSPPWLAGRSTASGTSAAFIEFGANGRPSLL